VLVDLAPLPRRLLRLAALLGLLLIAVVLNGLLQGGDDADPSGGVAEAAARTQQTGGGRITMTATYSRPGGERKITARGHGVYNERSGRSRIAITIPAGLSTTKLIAVGDESRVFVRAREIAAELPRGRSWLGMQPWVGGRSDAAAIGGNGGADGLEVLRAAGGEAESLGTAAVRGVSTERWRGRITMSRYAATLRAEGKRKEAKVYAQVAEQVSEPVEVEAWVWPDGLVRRVRTVTTIGAGPGGSGLTMDMVVDLHDLGITPRIPLPPAGKVFDTTPITRAELGLLDGEAAMPQSTAGGRSLSAEQLRNGANAICGLMTREAESLVEESGAMRLLNRLGSDADLGEIERALRAYGNGIVAPFAGLARRGLGQLAGLRPPPRLRADYDRFLRSLAETTEAFEGLGRAAQLGNLGAVETLQPISERISERNDVDARKLGLHACAQNDKDGGSGVGGSGSLS
jgi:hypothetical protein